MEWAQERQHAAGTMAKEKRKIAFAYLRTSSAANVGGDKDLRNGSAKRSCHSPSVLGSTSSQSSTTRR